MSDSAAHKTETISACLALVWTYDGMLNHYNLTGVVIWEAHCVITRYLDMTSLDVDGMLSIHNIPT